jgi:hypothetical protein
MSFWGELKRRNVFKVGAAYLIAAWLILQVASITFPAFHLPGWALTFVTVILIIGLPLALIFSWAFELTPDGVKRSENVPLDESITNVTGRKLNYVLAGLLIVAVGCIVIDKVFVSRGPAETQMEPYVAEQAIPTTEVKEDPLPINFVMNCYCNELFLESRFKTLYYFYKWLRFIFGGKAHYDVKR